MSTEQERAEFEAWARRHLGMPEHIAFNWEADWTLAALEGYRAGRAALQSQDREDAARFRFCLERGFPQKWEEMIRGSLRYYWTSRPGSQEEFSSAIEAIDHARRVEGDV